MAEPFLGEIRVFSFYFAPRSWAMCNGQLLPINQNQGLFSLLGTTYGGNGSTTFALPNLQGRTPIHEGNGFSLGEASGSATQTLITSEMPTHTHALQATTASADRTSPAGGLAAYADENLYSKTASTNGMDALAAGSTGGSQPHSNMQPYLVLNFCIALSGIFPSQT